MAVFVSSDMTVTEDIARRHSAGQSLSKAALGELIDNNTSKRNVSPPPDTTKRKMELIQYEIY